MKKLMLLAAGIVASAFLVSGCQSFGSVQQSPAQIAAVLCPATNSAITQITAFNAAMAPTLPAAANANVVIEKTVKPIVDGTCAAGATITSTSIQALITQGIPAIAGVVAALPLAPTTQAAIQAGFAAAELAVNLVGTYENALQAAKTSTAIPAAAPATTSRAMLKFQPGDVLTAGDLNSNFQSLNQRLSVLEGAPLR
ncbi:putative phage lipoprotein [Burkholderia aenigmatica]|uniref:Phage lipoprotein n=1 Tax=Burkholderia aenigmatica TaxID=2015348 RepID=A0ABY6Y2R4_9BURK|nr:hypothetical protein [Burkholderia aenigmatica]VWD02560.1 putative phage lipoprotein [Burkholderia aenigmatica]